MDTRRDQIIDIIQREFIGPDPINKPGFVQPNGEEILISDPPRIRYIAGILFPQAAPIESSAVEDEDVDSSANEDLSTEDTIQDKRDNAESGSELFEQEEEVLNLSNAYHQSAISLTASVRDNATLHVRVHAGTYCKIELTDPSTEKKTTKYPRTQLKWVNDDNPISLPSKKERKKECSIICDGKKTSLLFIVTYRYPDHESNSTIFTFTLRNVNSQQPNGAIHDEDCYFQVGFSLSSEGFSPLPESKRVCVADDDYQSNQLLYRNIRSYAVGHGCSAAWDEEDVVKEIRTSVFPTFEVKPIVPNQMKGVSLEMYDLSDHGDFQKALAGLDILCQHYNEWIENLRKKAEDIPDKQNFRSTAVRHINACRKCLKRMENGVNLLKTNPTIRKAFQYMNRAMLMQQLHYNLPLQTWQDAGNGTISLIDPIEALPDPDKRDTWYGPDPDRYGKWRPFQLAFVLINLESMADRKSAERKDVDLIWFPTGGGKTEAYLGLSAYTIFIRKLLNPSDSGTTILMRYTLRLLTSQQYERAAAMICACEIIRQEKESELGSNRISIGLWVGKSTTPNKMTDAVSAYEQLYSGKKDENPFVMLKCPWCGAQMGPVSINGRQRRLPGYRKVTGKTKTIIFQCSNTKCDFSSEKNPLPLMVIDDAIYKMPPTLLLGTVDKFAMLPFVPEAQTLFGIFPTGRRTPPDLIIQDELHLISGPLGSMVGHYETMIHELCTDRRNENEITPKIIASTATISRAKEQCNSLYDCGKEHVIQFPPSGIDAGDSFFAVEDKTVAGRKYVGILASGSSSYATTTIRLYAALLYAAKAINVDTEDQRDPYWTNIGYFNSLRELGQAATWVSADIDEYLHTIYKRRQEKKQLRYIYEFDELTSRISGDRIPAKLQDLAIQYSGVDQRKRPTDICLATNMISVGVDVSRLGLMTVTGQPKTTSEYIQATSRVGRSAASPGIVFVTYNPGKPRDKSFYEQFRTYHAKLYCHVEPTSVTPFSAPLRERALHAILIGLVRLLGNPQTYDRPDALPSESEIRRLFNLIEERVASVDPDELENTERHLDEIMRDWKDWNPQKYQDFSSGDIVPLMYPAGTVPNLLWEKRGLPTPTSMRSVDASCEVYPLSNHYESEVE